MSTSLSKKALEVKPSSTLEITAKAKAMKAQGIDVVGFGAGEPDFNTPENICNAAKSAIDNGFTKYTPASGMLELKKAISAKLKRFNNLDYDADQIVISNGGKHSLTNVFQSILNPGDEVIIPIPYWLTYPEIVKLYDGKPVFINATKEQDYKVSAKDIESVITSNTKALILNSPSNPTGMIYNEDELRAIGELAVKYDFYIVSDEMYENLTYEGAKHVSIASLDNRFYDKTITCSGMSKAYAMTGWRIGYTASSKELAKVMGSVQSHETSNPNSIAQFASIEALNGPQDDVEKMRLEFDKRRKYMIERIDEMPYISMPNPLGAFYAFVDLSELVGKKYNDQVINNAADVANILLDDYHTAIVPCQDFGCPNHMRLSYATSLEIITEGLNRIDKFLKELK